MKEPKVYEIDTADVGKKHRKGITVMRMITLQEHYRILKEKGRTR